MYLCSAIDGEFKFYELFFELQEFYEFQEVGLY